MRKITDEGCLFLYGAGLLVTAETGIPAVIAILFVCIYTCVNLVGEEKYLHYIMTQPELFLKKCGCFFQWFYIICYAFILRFI